MNDLHMKQYLDTLLHMPTLERYKSLTGLIDSLAQTDISFINTYTSSKLKIDFIARLPAELAVHILAQMEGREVIRISQVCKYWHQIIYDNDLWRQICSKNGWTDRRFIESPPAVRSSRFYSRTGSKSNMSLTLCRQPSFSYMNSKWKTVFIDKYLTGSNWESGKCLVRRLKPRSLSLTSTFHDKETSPSRRTTRSNSILISPTSPPALINEMNDETGDDVDSMTITFDDKLQSAISVFFESEADAQQGPVFWNTENGSLQFRLTGHQGAISAVRIDSRHIVTGGVDRSIRIWDAKNGKCLKTLTGHEGEVECLQFDSGNDVIASGGQDKTIRIWSLNEGRCLAILNGHDDGVTCLKIDGDHIISGSADKSIRIWQRTGRGQYECTLKLTGHQQCVNCLNVDSDRIISGSADRTIKVWDRRTGRLLRSLEGHLDSVVCLQSDGHKIVSGSIDQSIKCWSLKTGQLLYTMKQHAAAIWNLKFNENKLLSTSFDRTVIEWDFGGMSCLSATEKEQWKLESMETD